MRDFENHVAEDINDILDELDEQRAMIKKITKCLADMSEVLTKLTEKVLEIDRKNIRTEHSREEELLKAFCKFCEKSGSYPLGYLLKNHIGMTEAEAYKYAGVTTVIW